MACGRSPRVAVFAALGGLENMQEEIIPLVPVLLLLGRGLGVDAISVVAMSAGAALVGSAFSPVNPFQAGIALRLAELPLASGFGLRLWMFVAGTALWIGWTIMHARRTRSIGASRIRLGPEAPDLARRPHSSFRSRPDDGLRLRRAAARAGASTSSRGSSFWARFPRASLEDLRLGGTTWRFSKGCRACFPAALLIGLARSISLVLRDGRIIDSILNALATPLALVPAAASALLMIPFHAIVHVPVPSVSGQAVLTMPILVPLADLLGMSRQAPVLAYQTGAGLMELLTPTNGALMAVLLAAGVPYGQWLRFAIVGYALGTIVGIAGIIAVVWFGIA